MIHRHERLLRRNMHLIKQLGDASQHAQFVLVSTTSKHCVANQLDNVSFHSKRGAQTLWSRRRPSAAIDVTASRVCVGITRSSTLAKRFLSSRFVDRTGCPATHLDKEFDTRIQYTKCTQLFPV